MCGRYSFTTSKEKVKKSFGVLHFDKEFKNSYNIAPTHAAMVISNQDPTRLVSMEWGIVPYWARDGKNSGKLINARAEDINSKPSFRIPIRRQRCLVLADSFYEWKKNGSDKTPYRIMPKEGNALAMAGVWDKWGEDLYTFSIITVAPNEEMSKVHNRMPLLFTDKESQEKWLSELSLKEVGAMLQTPQDDLLTMYPISNLVNSPANNSLKLHKEFKEPPTLF